MKNAATGALVDEMSSYTQQSHTYPTKYYCDLDGDACEWTIFDSFGDGVCCNYGSGSYSISCDGEVVVSGGSFQSTQSVAIEQGEVTVQCNDDGTCDAAGEDCSNCESDCGCCSPPVCQSDIDCNGGSSCTENTCLNAGTCSASCDYTPNDAICDNGDFCDGAETCDPTNGCQSGTPPNCDDGVGCTDDSCNNGACVNTPNDGNCSSGDECNGAETCHATNDCQAGPVFSDETPCIGSGGVCCGGTCASGVTSCPVCNDKHQSCTSDSDCCENMTCHHKKNWCN